MVCKDHLADPDTVYVFDNHFGVFGEGTRLAMPKTIQRAGLIVGVKTGGSRVGGPELCV